MKKTTTIKGFVFCFLFSTFVVPTQPTRAEEPVQPAVHEDPPVNIREGNPVLVDARMALEAGQWRQARRTLKKFVGDNKKSAEGWTLLGRTYFAIGAYGKALSRFDKALKYDSHYSPAYLGRGEVYEKKGRLDEAANDFRAATLADPISLEAREALARLSPKDPAVDSRESSEPGQSVAPKDPEVK